MKEQASALSLRIDMSLLTIGLEFGRFKIMYDRVAIEKGLLRKPKAHLGPLFVSPLVPCSISCCKT
jgi:hypothetical protein